MPPRLPLRHFFTIRPVNSAASSALAYVPAVLLSRGLAFLRNFAVAWILAATWTASGTPAGGSASGEPEPSQSIFGAYQTALEFVNLLVPLLMLGAGDVAERYIAQIHSGRGDSASWLRRQVGFLLARTILALAVLASLGGFLSRWIWGAPANHLYFSCLVTVALLAFYQYLASLLRGIRAYGAAAGLELSSALLLLAFSCLAAAMGQGHHLMWAYAASVLLPLAVYAPLAWKHLHQTAETSIPEPPLQSVAAPALAPPAASYAIWTLLRLLLVMAFGFLCIWGVGFLARNSASDAAARLAQAADFSLPYRVAQLLGFLGVTLWSSVFAIAAAMWSQGRRRRAAAQFFRVGRLGMATLLLLAAALLASAPVVAGLLPAAYADAILLLLPGMLTLFYWYALLLFLSSYADLRESPYKGAALWALVVALQVAGIGLTFASAGQAIDPRAIMLLISAAALAISLLLLAPMLLGPLRRTTLPLALMAIAPAAFFVPRPYTLPAALAAVAAVITLLAASGQLFRRADRRSFARWRRRHRAALR